MIDKEIVKQIEKYVEEGLSDTEEDLLWIEFLKDHKWLKYYEAYQDIFKKSEPAPSPQRKLALETKYH